VEKENEARELRTDSLSLLGSAVIAAKSIWIPKGSTSFLASSFVQSQRIISERRVRLVVGVSALGEDSVRSSFPAKTDLRKWSSGSVRSEKYCLQDQEVWAKTWTVPLTDGDNKPEWYYNSRGKADESLESFTGADWKSRISS